MTNTSDPARRRLIVQQSEDTPRDPHGVTLTIKICLHGGGHGFIRAKGADDLSCTNDLIVIAELAKLIDQLRRKQLKRAAAAEGITNWPPEPHFISEPERWAELVADTEYGEDL